MRFGWRSRAVRVPLAGGTVIVGSVLSACGVCAPTTEACDRTFEIGERYEVELVQHLRPDFLDRTSGIGHADRTCGVGFDLHVDDRVLLHPVERVQVPPHECQLCYRIRARFEVPGVQWTGSTALGGVNTIGHGAVFQDTGAIVREGCRGWYEIGLETVPLLLRSPFFATDYVLYRGFHATNPPACAAPGTWILDPQQQGICSDAWAVRIRDSKGKLLTRDVQGAPPWVAEWDDAGMEGSDAGR